MGRRTLWCVVKVKRSHRQAVSYASVFFASSHPTSLAYVALPLPLTLRTGGEGCFARRQSREGGIILLNDTAEREIIDASHIKNTQRFVRRSCSRAKRPFRGHSSFLSSVRFTICACACIGPRSRQDLYQEYILEEPQSVSLTLLRQEKR